MVAFGIATRMTLPWQLRRIMKLIDYLNTVQNGLYAPQEALKGLKDYKREITNVIIRTGASGYLNEPFAEMQLEYREFIGDVQLGETAITKPIPIVETEGELMNEAYVLQVADLVKANEELIGRNNALNEEIESLKAKEAKANAKVPT